MPFWKSIDFLSVGGFAITVISTILAIVFYCRGKVKKTLVYQISTSDLITDEINNTPGIKISVGDEPAVNVISSTITFSNTGNQTINSSDFASLSPLQIITSEHFFNAENIDISYIKSCNKALNPKIEVCEKNRIIIEFEYLKPKQEFEITVLHDGDLSVDGDLTSGAIQDYYSAPEISRSRNFSKILVPILIIIVSGMIVRSLTQQLSLALEMYSDSTKLLNNTREDMLALQLEIDILRWENSELQKTINSLYENGMISESIEGRIPD